MITETAEGINKWKDDLYSWMRLINTGKLSRLPNAIYAFSAISVKIVLKMALHSSLPFPDQLHKQVLEASTPISKHFFSLWDVCWTTLHWVFWVFVIKKYVSWAQEDLRRGQLCSFLMGTSFRFNSASSSSSWPASCSTCKRPHRYLPSLSLSWWQKSVTCAWHMSEEDPGPAVLNILPDVPAKRRHSWDWNPGVRPQSLHGCTGHVAFPESPWWTSKPTTWPKYQRRVYWRFKLPFPAFSPTSPKLLPNQKVRLFV